MFRALSAFFALVAVVLGFYVWQLSGDVSFLREQLATAQKDAKTAHAAEDTARQQVDAIRLAEAKAAAPEAPPTEQAGQSGALSANAGGPKAKTPDGGGMSAMAKMFQTEDGKKMMKAQIGMVTKMQYGDLARMLNLSPEEAQKVMDLLTERGTEMAGNPWKFMGEGMDEAAIKKMQAESEATRKNYDSMLKNELGDEGFQHFQEYEKTIGERMALSQIEPQFSAGGNPLQPDQRDRLLQLMADERKNSPPSPFDSTGRDTARNMELMKDDAAVDSFIKQEDDYHQRVVQQAASILNPEQVKSLQQGLNQMAEMQKFGIKMGKEMMKGNGPKPPTAVVAPAAK
jgi:hypothetical protein